MPCVKFVTQGTTLLHVIGLPASSAVSTASSAAATAATTTAVTTAAAIFLRFGLVDLQLSAIDFLAIKFRDRFLAVFF